MSAADRMVVRTPAGYRSVPRRVGLGMISAGRAKLATGGAATGGYPEPGYTTESADAPLTPADEPQAAVVPATPDSAPTRHHRPRTIQFQPDGPKVRADGTNEPADDADEHQALAATTTEPTTITGTPAKIAATMDALAPVGDAEPDSIPADIPARELPPEPKPTARRGEWADYADSLGVEVTSAMTKREIQQAAAEAATSLSNLPQPALTGGRLETPEDEPATETVADDQDPRTR